MGGGNYQVTHVIIHSLSPLKICAESVERANTALLSIGHSARL